MQAIVCFSGGYSSALAAVETVRRYGKDSVILLNHDISPHVEHEDIKRFKREVSKYLDIPITHANADGWEQLTPLEVCRRKKGFSAGTHQTFCTHELKTKPFYKFLEQFPKSPDVHIVYGFDAVETNRIMRRTNIIRAMGYTPEFPLADSPAIQNIEGIGIKRPSTYRLFKHANCIGCLKAGKQHWYCVYCLRPDIWADAKAAEQEIGYSIINGTYLHELEPKFYEMRNSLGICPNDKEQSQTFWARVEQTLPEQTSLLPCDCMF